MLEAGYQNLEFRCYGFGQQSMYLEPKIEQGISLFLMIFKDVVKLARNEENPKFLLISGRHTSPLLIPNSSVQ